MEEKRHKEHISICIGYLNGFFKLVKNQIITKALLWTSFIQSIYGKIVLLKALLYLLFPTEQNGTECHRPNVTERNENFVPFGTVEDYRQSFSANFHLSFAADNSVGQKISTRSKLQPDVDRSRPVSYDRRIAALSDCRPTLSNEFDAEKADASAQTTECRTGWLPNGDVKV
uniref:Uncharacterized protein n=1 Tax=Romanomermis culicivorax TaxID=13658 RepID=A0A915K897_ROMCU